jgi:creatinine amidohydrolase
MARSVMMAEMTWPEYQRRIQHEGAIVFLPLGATEQHGPHMTMGVDHMLPTAVARSVAERVGGIVAPAVAYGYKSQPKSGGGNHFVGTTSLSGATVSAIVSDIIAEFGRHEANKVVVVNGHYENTMFTVEGIDLALRRLHASGNKKMKVMRLDYFEFTTQATLQNVFPDGFPGWALEHAAVFETSLMLHFYPECVNMAKLANDPPAKFPPYDVYPTDIAWVPPSGVLSPAHGASAEKGRLMAEEYAERIAEAVRREFGSSN